MTTSTLRSPPTAASLPEQPEEVSPSSGFKAQQVRQVLARVGLLRLAPPDQQVSELPVLRAEMVQLALQVRRGSRAHRVLLDSWVQRAIPVLQVCRATGVLPGPQVILAASERRALQA